MCIYTEDVRRSYSLLSKKQQRTIKTYTKFDCNSHVEEGKLYFQLNSSLRGVLPSTRNYKKIIRILDSCFKHAIKPSVAVVYRGQRHFGDLQNKQIGDQFQNISYWSTSYKKYAPISFCSEPDYVGIEISQPFGLPTNNSLEAELLIPRLSRFKVVDIRHGFWSENAIPYDTKNTTIYSLEMLR